MPDLRATMASASSEVWRCWMSKSAGTYSASITGVIGSTFSRLTFPLQVFDSVAAVAIAGFARSVSARSSGTRMELNICASLLRISNLAHLDGLQEVSDRRVSSEACFSNFGLTKQHQSPAAECRHRPNHRRRNRKRQGRPSAGFRRAPRPAALPLPASAIASSCIPGLCPTIISRADRRRRRRGWSPGAGRHRRRRVRPAIRPGVGNEFLHRFPGDFPGLKRAHRGDTSTRPGKGGCRPIQPPISAASWRPRLSSRRS